MLPAPLPENEEERLRYLDELQILDTLEEAAYDDLTFLAAQICNTPIALVSLVDRERQWFKSHHGLDAHETPRNIAFCAHAILTDETLVIEDTLRDKRFFDNPLVTGAPEVKFYAGAPLILRDNIHVGTLCVIDQQARSLDSSQRRALEALARQVVSQLELRLQLQAAARLDQTKDEFISMVNHELRTPLTAINGALSLLNNGVAGSLPSKAVTLVDVAHRNGERLLNIVNDILDVAKLEAGKMKLQMQGIELVPFLQKALDLNRMFYEGQGCRAVLHLAPTSASLRVLGDEQRLLQVMSNLISNAAKFSRAGDQIEISFQREQGKVTVSVTDHGIGISADDQKYLFTKFKQLENQTHTKAPGTGLGLNICKLIIEQHGGSIVCESIPQQATSFRFTLNEATKY